MENCIIFSYDGDVEFYNDVGYPLFDIDKNELVTGALFDDVKGCVVRGEPTIKQRSSNKFIISVVNWWNYGDCNSKTPDNSWADLVICTSSELPDENWESYHEKTCSLLKNKNVIYIMNGKSIYDNYPEDIFFCPNLYFFKTVNAGNEPISYKEGQRPYLFDALLGSKKLHKFKIFDFFKESKLLEKSIVSFLDGPHHIAANLPEYTYETPNLSRLEDPVIFNYKNVPPDSSDSRLYYLGRNCEKTFKNTVRKMWASNVISHKIYQNSWYSFICETNITNFHFLTEKTAKCIFAKRIFVCYAAHGTLQFLRDQGFKTFDGIIDESYDKEPDNDKRLSMVLEQTLWLSKQDPVKLYEQAKHIIYHNYKMITKSDLNTSAMKKFIQNNIDRIKNGNSI